MKEYLQPDLNLVYPNSCTDIVVSDKDYGRDGDGDIKVSVLTVTVELQLLDRSVPLNCPTWYTAYFLQCFFSRHKVKII